MDFNQISWRQFRSDPPICSVIHFSDPHFGGSFVTQDDSWWIKLSGLPMVNLVTGLFPHSYQLACALALAIGQIIQHRQANGVDTVVVHSGDLTASGTNAEFSVGKTFVEGGHYAQPGRQIGLGLDARSSHTRLLDIPGNHDLWSRKSPRGSNAFSQHYGGVYPRIIEVQNSRGTVIFYGLDSNRSSQSQHRLANGEVPAEQLNALAAAIAGEADKEAVRIVSLHHPVHVEPAIAPKLLGKEVLKLRSRDAVARQLHDLGVHATLSGHIHKHRHYRAVARRPASWIAGSACQLGGTAQFWLLDLYRDAALYCPLVCPRNQITFWPETSGYKRCELPSIL